MNPIHALLILAVCCLGLYAATGFSHNRAAVLLEDAAIIVGVAAVCLAGALWIVGLL